MPFQGRGDLPPGQDVIDIYVSAFVDRLLEVIILQIVLPCVRERVRVYVFGAWYLGVGGRQSVT